MTIDCREGMAPGSQGLKLHWKAWNASEPRSSLLIIHGLGEHAGRYADFARFLAGTGITVFSFDLRGHGRSEGVRGFVPKFDDYVETLGLFHQQVNRDFGSVPKILMGHSMGGLISTLYLLDHQSEFAACILSGPAIKTDLEPPFLQLMIIRILSLFAPKMGALQLDATGVCRDEETVKRYRDDPLVYSGKLSARLVAELFRSMGIAQAGAAKITLPMMLLHGGEDSMASPAGSQFLYDAIGSDEKQLTIYPGLFHEIFNEPEREQVFAEMLEWLEKTVDMP